MCFFRVFPFSRGFVRVTFHTHTLNHQLETIHMPQFYPHINNFSLKARAETEKEHWKQITKFLPSLTC